jgi:hypothetical protein
MRFALSLLASLLFVGCASSSIRPEDMAKLGAAPTMEDIDKIAHGSPLYRLDYLASDHTFIYETYEASDTKRYYGLLFRDGKLIAVDEMPLHLASWPSLWHCTLFPPDPSEGVDACFQAFNRSAEASAVKIGSDVAGDQVAKSQDYHEVEGAVAENAVEIALFAPILIPAAAIALPVMGVTELADESQRASLKVVLGEPYEDVRSRVEGYPAKFVSVVDGNGTVLVPGAGVSEVSAAFGVADGKVVWIDLSPKAGCGGGLLSKGKYCSMGRDKPLPHDQ